MGVTDERLILVPSTSKQNHRKAIFLDRDGVINRKLPEDYYVRNSSEFDLLPNVLDALAIFRDLGFAIVVVTNQRGIGRGIMTEKDLSQVHDFMKSLLRDAGLELAGLYYCPHDKIDDCDCRKPAPGMILSAAKDLNIDLSSSFMVGDSVADIEAGKNAGVRSVRICQTLADYDSYEVFPSLIDFAQFLQHEVSCSSKKLI